MAVRRDAVVFQKRDFRAFLSHEMWVPPALCVSLRFGAFQQFGDNWREFGEKDFSPKLSLRTPVFLLGRVGPTKERPEAKGENCQTTKKYSGYFSIFFRKLASASRHGFSRRASQSICKNIRVLPQESAELGAELSFDASLIIGKKC